MNITLPIVTATSKVTYSEPTTVTFYSIDAISPFKDTSYSVIYSSGKEFICTYSYSELWDKLK